VEEIKGAMKKKQVLDVDDIREDTFDVTSAADAEVGTKATVIVI
jgi:hypothetical protein